MKIIHEITLDLSRHGVQCAIPVAQHEVGMRRLIIRLRNGSEPVKIESCDYAVLYLDTDLFDPVTVYTENGAYPNCLVYDISARATSVAGEHTAVLQFFRGSEQLAYSPEFAFAIRKDLTAGSAVLSSPQYAAILEIRDELENQSVIVQENVQKALYWAKDAEESAKALKNPSMEAVKENGVATVTFTDAVGNRSSLEILDGVNGKPFTVSKTYPSVEEMQAGYTDDGVEFGGFVIIETGSVQNEDNAKLYVKGESQYVFVSDLSGFQGLSAFVRYSAFPDGSDFSEKWDWSRKYVGFATSHEAPTDKKDYQWVAIGDDTFVVVDGALMLKCDESSLNSGGVFIIEASFLLNDCMMGVYIHDESGQTVGRIEWGESDGLEVGVAYTGKAEVTLEPGVYSISTYMCSVVSISKKADLEIRQSSGASESSVMSQRAATLAFSNALIGQKEGELITIHDLAVTSPLIQCRIKSKNMIPYPYYNTTMSQAGITYTDNEDGSVSVSGTTTTYTSFTLANALPLEHGKTYSFKDLTGGVDIILSYYNKKGVIDYAKDTIIWDSSYMFHSLYIQIANKTVDNIIVYPMMIEGHFLTDAVYVPYLQNIDTVRVNVSGKNLATAQQIYNGNTQYKELIFEDRNCIRFIDNTGIRFTELSFRENTQYTVSFEAKVVLRETNEGDSGLFYFFYNDGTKSLITASSNTDWTKYTLTSIRGKTVSAIGTGTYNYVNYIYIDVDTFQLETGTAATEYEPHREPIVYEVDQDGFVNPVMPIYPITTLTTNTKGVMIEAKYNRDINKAFEELTQAILSLGGNI